MIKLIGINKANLLPTHVEKLQAYIIANTESEDPSKNNDKLELANALFRRASSSFLKDLRLQDQANIVQDIETFILDLSKEKISLENLLEFKTKRLNEEEPLYSITIAIKDRSFIIDTVNQSLNYFDLEPECYLHPVLEINSKNVISLSYIEVRLKELDDINVVENELKKRLECLIEITDSFSEMSEMISSISNFHDNNETAELLNWLQDGSFIFMGTNLKSNNSEKSFGLFNQTSYKKLIERSLNQDFSYSISHLKSPVHRYEFLNLIQIRTSDDKELSIIGILSTQGESSPALSVPIIKNKLLEIINQEGLITNSHDYKESINLFDCLPKTTLFSISQESLRNLLQVAAYSQAHDRSKVELVDTENPSLKVITTFLSKESFSKLLLEEITELIKASFIPALSTIEARSKVGDYELVPASIFFFQAADSKQIKSLENLEKEINLISTSWEERLHHSIKETFEDDSVQRLFSFYSKAFNKSYQVDHTPEEGARDILMLEKLSSEFPIDISIEDIELYREKLCYRIRIYKLGEPLILSDILPFIENVGFQIISEKVSIISVQNSVWSEIYDLTVTPKMLHKIESLEVKANLVHAIRNLLGKQITNDQLNYLLLSPGIREEEISIFRGLIRYIVQIKTGTSEGLIEALISNPITTSSLLELFKTKFDPQNTVNTKTDELGIASEERKQKVENLRLDIMTSLRKVQNVAHDRSLRSILNVINSVLRTNFYNQQSEGIISFKIDCSKIVNIPTPIPYREIFVSGVDFQGTHLRGGKVARGGLRWSSRKDDFRTEVLGLMKTQMIKNAVIVPVGAKGGFILHDEPTERKELLEAVKNNYKNFIRALLQVTDNRIGTDVIHPTNCICYDEKDPYFVVAADRGTATFSNIANSIAEDEFNFWLGDAFASGGKSGYDHKELGITAKGAWECAKRHFKELGIDIINQDFKVIGIGDMSGDVFGNGLILSNRAKLIAAFDHRHIFIDPDPDPAISFAERKRLFELSSSSWEDYASNLLSKGGAIYSRSEKEITPSEEAKKILDLKEESYTPSELIRAILMAPADLLWNGGIGTYFKASTETHGHASDRANDEVRVDANQLKVRIIAEGGNLGLTQLARIEYSMLGGKINTDAIDNSGGVDMSDLEVNLKLLFRESINNKEISVEQRNTILKECEIEACEKIVTRNRNQSLLLSIGTRKSRTDLSNIKLLISYLEKYGKLNAKAEFVPDAETLDRRKAQKAGLSRPEFSILVAYLKMHIFDSLLESELPNDPYFKNFLISYFPSNISKQFPELLDKHPLRKEIISTQLANLIVERMGVTFILRMVEDFSLSIVDTVKIFTISDIVIGAANILKGLEKIDSPSNTKSYFNSILKLQLGIESISRCFVNIRILHSPIDGTINKYKLPFQTLINKTEEILNKSEELKYQDSLRELLIQGLPKDLARSLVGISYGASYLDVIDLSVEIQEDYILIAKFSSKLSSELRISEIIDMISTIHSDNHWDNLAITQLIASIRSSINLITKSIIKENNSIIGEDVISNYFSKRSESLTRYKDILNSTKNEVPSVSLFYVLCGMITSLSK